MDAVTHPIMGCNTFLGRADEWSGNERVGGSGKSLSWDLGVQSVCGLARTAQLGKSDCFPDNLGIERAIRLYRIGGLGQRLGGALSPCVTSGRRAFQETNPVPVSAGAEVGKNVDQYTRIGFVGCAAAMAAAGRRAGEAGDSKEAKHRKGTTTASGSAV
jgi:hypothetical protein